MVQSIFKVLTTLFLLTLFVNYAKTKINPDILSIINETTLQRKLEFSVNDTVKSAESFQTQNGSKLLHYLSLISEEMNEMSRLEEQKFKENPIPLPSAYVELSQDEVKFHEISFDDFVNFKKASVRLETLIPDGSDPNTIKIIYESKINEILLSGLAEINGSNCDFVLNITDLTLREEHERTPVPVGKIVTKSILETLTFKKFAMLIVLTEENKLIKSPNKQILRQLADSWLITIVNVVNSRFVQPKIIEQSQLYFRNYKHAFLEAICSSVSQTFSNSTLSIPSFENKNVRSDDSKYDKYIFKDIIFNNFSRISNCSSGSFSVEIEENHPTDNYYSHTIYFTFTYSSNKKFARPSVHWTLRKYKEEKRDIYGYVTQIGKINDEKHSVIVTYWSAKLTVFTDKNGRKIDKDVKVSIDFELENNGSARLNDLSNRISEQLGSSVASLL